MFKSVHNRVWAFDAEWVPDPLAARLMHDAPADCAPRQAMELLWQAGGASEENPTPFLKLNLCRVVSIAAIERLRLADNSVVVRLISLPHDTNDASDCSEAKILERFLGAAGEHKPQLVGYNSIDSDLKIFLQRALLLGLHLPDFCSRPAKPWEGVDYFGKGSESNVDLKEVFGGWGKSVPSLHQLAVQSGIPGKMDVDGNAVAELWLQGRLDEIVAYNECDALTTYLMWLRAAHLGGFFDQAGYELEQQRVEELLEREVSPAREHLSRFHQEWQRLRAIIETEREI